MPMTPLDPACLACCEGVKHAVMSGSILSVKVDVKGNNMSGGASCKGVKLTSPQSGHPALKWCLSVSFEVTPTWKPMCAPKHCMAVVTGPPEYSVECVVSCPLSHEMYDNEGLLCCACADL